MRFTIPVEKDALKAVRGFLKQLLETKVVDALLVPMETPTGTITPALVTDVDLLDAANPLAPVMGINTARAVAHVTVREPRLRIGTVLRPCELRALVELVKLKQASLDDLVTIGVDCAGTYDVPDYTAKAQKRKSQSATTRARNKLWRDLYDGLMADPSPSEGSAAAPSPSEGSAAAPSPSEGSTAAPSPSEGSTTAPSASVRDLRDACQMCEKPYIEGADITIELFGADLSAGIPVTLPDEMAQTLGVSPVEDDSRATVIEKVVAKRTRVRDARFGEMHQRLEEEGIEEILATCVRCHNCMTVCPICYCKTCLFKSPAFDHESVQYVEWARRKGAYRLPADTMLFHLTRLNHMVLSCVGCGMCTSDCPADLPVGLVFRTIGQEVQQAFDYMPGRDVEEPLPLVTFREDEWGQVEE
jgi:formate dehydrogenase subunit beta